MNKNENNIPKPDHNNEEEHRIAALVAAQHRIEANQQRLEPDQGLIGPQLPEDLDLNNNQEDSTHGADNLTNPTEADKSHKPNR